MTRKKILHFVSGLEVGGTETQLLRIIPLLEKKLENRVCCFNGHGPIGEKLKKKGIKVYYLFFKGRKDLSVILRMRKVIKDFKPDIMITYLIHSDLVGRVLGKFFGIKKIICSKRGSMLQWEWLSKIDCLTKRFVDCYQVQTETAKKEWMKKLKLPSNKFTIIPNGIDIAIFEKQTGEDAKRNELGIKKNTLAIVCISKLRQGKGHDFLLEAFENLYFNNYRNVTLLIVGDGERNLELRQKISNYKSRNSIKFLGERNDIPEILAISDIFILPTEGEGMSNAILEAMSARVPIITTNIPQNKEMLKHMDSALLINPRNASEIESAIKTLLDNKKLSKKLSDNAYALVKQNYNINRISERIADFYNSL